MEPRIITPKRARLAMKWTGEEPDYLVGAQPDRDPHLLPQLVREAFALEYQVTKDGQIAEIVGRDKSRISQVFNNPASVESSTIRHLVSFLKSRDHRRKIIAAWEREYFGKYVSGGEVSHYLGAIATERTRRRVDRLIREGQLGLAACIALEAVNKTEDVTLQEEFLDRAYFTHQRLDQPGQAMLVARLMAVRAHKRGDHYREVGALLFRCRILLGLADTKLVEVMPVLDQAENLLQLAGTEQNVPYFTGSRDYVASSRDWAAVTFMERKELPIDERYIRQILDNTLARGKRSRSYQRRFGSYLLAARCHLLLGERFQAEELLEKSFKSGSIKNLNAYEVSGLLMARIQASSEEPTKRADYLLEVIANCAASLDRYHQRLAEWDFARVEAQMFPPSRPAV